MSMTDTALPSPTPTGRGRALLGPALAAVAAGAAVARLHQTSGIDVAPFALCPLHAATGLWCPFCGGLRAVAALSRGDVAAAVSSNLPVTLLLPVVTTSWCLWLYAGWRARPGRQPTLSNRSGAVLGVVLLLFTVWRNLPQLPLGAWLAP